MGVVLLKRKLTSFQIIILGFSGVILFGTFLLMLPFSSRGVLALLLRRVSSPVMGIQLSRCFFGFVTVFFIDNPQSPC